LQFTYQEAIARWAKGKPLVNRLWVFGSRARGDQRPDSDIDIAVELDVTSIQGRDYSGGYATWSFFVREWKIELNDLLGIEIDLQYFRDHETPIIMNALNQSSVLVYKKGSNEK